MDSGQTLRILSVLSHAWLLLCHPTSWRGTPKPQQPLFLPGPQFCPDTGRTVCAAVDYYPTDQIFHLLAHARSQIFNLTSLFVDERKGDVVPNLAQLPTLLPFYGAGHQPPPGGRFSPAGRKPSQQQREGWRPTSHAVSGAARQSRAQSFQGQKRNTDYQRSALEDPYRGGFQGHSGNPDYQPSLPGDPSGGFQGQTGNQDYQPSLPGDPNSGAQGQAGNQDYQPSLPGDPSGNFQGQTGNQDYQPSLPGDPNSGFQGPAGYQDYQPTLPGNPSGGFQGQTGNQDYKPSLPGDQSGNFQGQKRIQDYQSVSAGVPNGGFRNHNLNTHYSGSPVGDPNGGQGYQQVDPQRFGVVNSNNVFPPYPGGANVTSFKNPADEIQRPEEPYQIQPPFLPRTGQDPRQTVTASPQQRQGNWKGSPAYISQHSKTNYGPPGREASESRLLVRRERQISRRNEDVEVACQVRSTYVPPRAALNDNSEWKYIVNIPERDRRFSQVVKVDVCVNEGQPCSSRLSLPFGFESRCRQKYIKKKLLSLNADGQGTSEDNFFIPSCCVCEITRPNKR